VSASSAACFVHSPGFWASATAALRDAVTAAAGSVAGFLASAISWFVSASRLVAWSASQSACCLTASYWALSSTAAPIAASVATSSRSLSASRAAL
jgi:hypothetical protein